MRSRRSGKKRGSCRRGRGRARSKPPEAARGRRVHQKTCADPGKQGDHGARWRRQKARRVVAAEPDAPRRRANNPLLLFTTPLVRPACRVCMTPAPTATRSAPPSTRISSSRPPSPPHPFANPSPPPRHHHRQMPALPSSTSESHLARTHRAPPQPKPPAQPTKVRPFILRGTSATAPPSSAAPGRPADRASPSTSTEGSSTGALKKSKTSVDVAQHAEPARFNDASRAEDKARRRRTAVGRSDLAMISASQQDTVADRGRRLGLTRSPTLPSSSSSSSASRRPVSLATSSLRAISSSHTSSTSPRPSPTPRARPLSYVSSPTSPPPDTASPPRRRPMSFAASPSPPSKLRPTASSSARAAAPAKPVISPTRARALSPAASAAVEEHKAALKRRTLAARQLGGAESPTEGSSSSAAGMRRSGRWFGRLASVASDDSAPPEAQDENSAPSRPDSPLGARSSASNLRVAQMQALPPATPPPAVAGLRGPGKKASFTALGRGRAQARAAADAPVPRVDHDGAADPGFSSLQEVRCLFLSRSVRNDLVS